MTRSERLNLVLRVLMEAGVVAALAYWGVETAGSTAAANSASIVVTSGVRHSCAKAAT